MSVNAISLSELQGQIQESLKNSGFRNIWIRCEISEFNDRGHVYLELTESKDNKLVAKVSASIWKSNKEFILNKFEKGSSTSLKKDMQVLVQVTVSYHASFGVSLTITDIDPTYTVGQMMLKVQEIKNFLIQKGCFTKNKDMTLPQYFEHVAVLTPGGSAGEGDFRKDADRLELAGLCTFKYYHATMQGLQAETSMSEQIAQINQDNKLTPFDALIIIRGGGASADLSWLNNFKSALYICNSHMPVITGLGHEKDTCVLDEIACKNAGTPSKCIGFITQSNIQIIYQFKSKMEDIKAAFVSSTQASKNLLANSRINLKSLYLSRAAQASVMIFNGHSKTRNAFISNVNACGQALRGKKGPIELLFLTSIRKAAAKINQNAVGQEGLLRGVISKLKDRLKQTEKTLKFNASQKPMQLFEELSKAITALKNAARNRLVLSKSLITQAAQLNESALSRQITHGANELFERNQRIAQASSKSVLTLKTQFTKRQHDLILNQPLRTLERGYAIVRDEDGQLIKNAEVAATKKNMFIDFKDKSIKVINTGETHERITADIK